MGDGSHGETSGALGEVTAHEMDRIGRLPAAVEEGTHRGGDAVAEVRWDV
jgi:hypothetical protein